MATKEERRARREARNAELKARREAKRAESQAKYEARKAELRAKLAAGKAESQAKHEARRTELQTKLDAGKEARKPQKEANADRLQEIRDQLGSLDGVATLLGRREIKDLPNILWDDEQVRGALQGLYGGGQGLLVATDRRMVFVDKKLIGNRVKVEDFPYDSISSIQYQLKVLSATVTIFASGNKAEIEQVMPKALARSFCEAVRALISGGDDRRLADRDGASVQPEPKHSTVEQMADALERLADLRDRGLLSDEEFDEQKQSLLSKTSP